MSWGNTDNESSKPTWLTEEQRRYAIRTNRGWEIPLDGSGRPGATNSSGSVLMYPTELIVAMPFDPSTTGVTSTYFANRSINATGAGATAFFDTNYAPYFCSPLTGASFSFSQGVTSHIRFLAVDPNTTDLITSLRFSFTGTSMTSVAMITGSSLESVTGFAGGTITGGYGGISGGAAALRFGSGQLTGSYFPTVTVSDTRSLTGSVRIQVNIGV